MTVALFGGGIFLILALLVVVLGLQRLNRPTCPSCGLSVDRDRERCPYCGAAMRG